MTMMSDAASVSRTRCAVSVLAPTTVTGDDPERSRQAQTRRLVAVTLDESSIGRSNRDVEHERAVAIYDLLEDNSFAPNDDDGEGPTRCT